MEEIKLMHRDMERIELMCDDRYAMHLTFDSKNIARIEVTDGFDEIFIDINVKESEQIIEGLKQFIDYARA